MDVRLKEHRYLSVSFLNVRFTDCIEGYNVVEMYTLWISAPVVFRK